MMRSRLTDALKEAMKAKNQCKVSTLRLILAALKDRDIAIRGQGDTELISDDQILEMLIKMVRQRRESIKMYQEGGRVELAEREQEEIGIIEGFLPRQLTDQEIATAAAEVIDGLGAKGLKDMGRIMNTMKQRYPGRLDPGKASTIVKSLLV